MATSTPRLGLRKPSPVDLVSVQADLNDNYDKIEAEADRLAALIAGGDPLYTEVRSNVAQQIPSGGYPLVVFDTVIENPAGLWKPALTSRLTMPKAGLWEFEFHCVFPQHGSGARQANFVTNAASWAPDTEEGHNTIPTALNCFRTIRMALNQFIEVQVHQDTGGPLNVNGVTCNFTAKWVKA